MDGVGEWTTTSLAIGKGSNITVHKEIHFPHSIGLLYSAFTYYTGFKVNSGEYKLMGLAPYGKPVYTDVIKDKLIHIKDDGSFHNTSFNIRGEPIVCTPADAFKCFMGTELDLLVIANIMLNKGEQDKKLITNYNQNYDLD